MRSLVLLPALLAGCVCPRPLCDQWLHVRLASEGWAAGVYTVDVTAGEAVVHCTLAVTDPTRAPRPGEITYGPGVLADGFQYDTAGTDSGGSDTPGVVELRARTGRGTSLPTHALVHVTHDALTDAAPRTLVDDRIQLAWSSHPPRTNTCATGCADATLALALDPS